MARYIQSHEGVYINTDLVAEFYHDATRNATYVRYPGEGGWHLFTGDLTNELLGVSPTVTPEPGWVSVKDRLPELDQDVLVYAVGKIDGFIGEHCIEVCNRFIQHIYPSSPGHERWSSPFEYFHKDYEITHWMPLPEPPQEQTEETEEE